MACGSLLTLRDQIPRIVDCYWAPCEWQSLSLRSRADDSAASGHAGTEMEYWSGDRGSCYGDGDSAL